MPAARTTSPTRRAVTIAALALGTLLTPALAEARCVDMNGDPCPSGEQVHHVGTFNGAGKPFVAIHTGPRTSSKVVRRVRSGKKALIVCQTRGALASGPYGRSRIWDKLLHGGYVSDTRVYTGSDGRVAPDCAGPKPVPTYGNDPFAYDDAGRWIGPEGCSGGFTKGAHALSRWLKNHYRFTRSIGGYACRPNTADTSQMSLHGEGRALDWMVNASDAAQRRAVNRFTRKVSAENFRLGRAMGIQELIFNRRIWTASRHAEGWRAYTGPNAHTDHIHIGLNRAGASRRTSFWR